MRKRGNQSTIGYRMQEAKKKVFRHKVLRGEECHKNNNNNKKYDFTQRSIYEKYLSKMEGKTTQIVEAR